MNDDAIAFAQTEHLIKSGFQRISIITGGEHLNVCRNRIKGYKDALTKYDKEINESLISTLGMSYQEGRVGFQKLMSLSEKPDAIFATSDQITLAVYSEAKRMGLQIGSQFGLVAFSCDPLLGLLEPSVTGLGQKGFEMGSMAAQLCINEIENDNKNTKSRVETLSNELIIRKSSLKSKEENVEPDVEPSYFGGIMSNLLNLVFIFVGVLSSVTLLKIVSSKSTPKMNDVVDILIACLIAVILAVGLTMAAVRMLPILGRAFENTVGYMGISSFGGLDTIAESVFTNPMDSKVKYGV